MGFFDGPTIVTSGLTLLFNAADKNSYPGSGTTWTDLSGNNRNGTLINSPTFNSSNGGSIVFNGTNMYVTSSNSAFGTDPFSIDMWIKPNVSQTTNASVISVGTTTTTSNWQIAFQSNILTFVSTGSTASTTYTADNIWTNFTTVRESTSNNSSKIYINGNLNVSFTITNNYTDNTGYRLGINRTSTAYYAGNIANVQIYNRALSATEVFQNYDAQKSRFGL